MGKLRVGVIGTGSLGYFHLKAYQKNPDVEITAVCDSNKGRAEKVALEFGAGQVYGDYHEMLKSQELDAVSIVTSNHTHAPIAIEAIQNGKHVLCEKPPAVCAADAEKMAAISKEKGVLLMYGFIRRFGQSTGVLKELIEKGELGEIYYAKTSYLRRCGNPGGWFAQKQLSGGGPLIDLGVHIMDLAMFLMGKPKPVSVMGIVNDKVGARSNIKGISRYQSVDYGAAVHNVEDFAGAFMRFENGASLYVETSWTMHVKEDRLTLELFGDKGGAQLEPEFEIYSEKNDYLFNHKPVLTDHTFNFDQALQDEIDHFAGCILNGTECRCPAEDGVTVMKIIDAVYESARTGRMIIL